MYLICQTTNSIQISVLNNACPLQKQSCWLEVPQLFRPHHDLLMRMCKSLYNRTWSDLAVIPNKQWLHYKSKWIIKAYLQQASLGFLVPQWFQSRRLLGKEQQLTFFKQSITWLESMNQERNFLSDWPLVEETGLLPNKSPFYMFLQKKAITPREILNNAYPW